MRRLIRKHSVKLAVGIPAVLAYLASGYLGGVPQNTIGLQPKTGESIFLTTGETTTINLTLNTHTPINAIAASITYPAQNIRTRVTPHFISPINIWIQRPHVEDKLGILSFSGGITPKQNQRGALGTSTILTLDVTARSVGVATLHTNGVLLANDGLGTNVLTGTNDLTIYVRAPGLPTPDVNGDGSLSMTDAITVALHSAGTYDARFDVDGNGTVDTADAAALFNLINAR